MTYTQRIARKNEHYNQAVYMSQLEERNAIAQRIHDSIGHTLAGSLMQLEASKLLMTADTEKATAIIQNVINILREGMENIRLTLRTVKPQAEQIGINRVKLALDEFAICGISTKLTYNGDLNKINHLMWKVILENLNEALTNAAKYSKAYEVNVRIEVLNKVVKINIKDNGIGIRNFNGNIKKGLGILGMEERTSELGGKVIIDGSDGFSIIMLLPLGGEF